MTQKNTALILAAFLLWALTLPLLAQNNDDDQTLRVFIFAGQSNMVGSDSKVKDIKRFHPQTSNEAVKDFC